ncbi:MAG: DNA adenine methylase [Candidatus Saccharibacteria bacterium]|nr:DNA adenine methylase [Candidatus Saccharibacteria bacterium]
MNYIGSKLSLLDFIEQSVDEVTAGNYSSVCDLFAGTGAVGKHFKKKGKKIIANDIQTYSYVLNRHYIGNHKPLVFKNLESEISNLKKSDDKLSAICSYLTSLPGQDGFIFTNYCIGGGQGRQYFSDENGRKCDAIRNTIEGWYKHEKINEDEYYCLLCSLLESVDKVANTASVYGAFLKSLKKTAQKPLELVPPELIINEKEHLVLNSDANKVASEQYTDVLYLDPPYNQRQYATNYHLLETIAKNDNPTIHGKTGLRDYASQKSLYCSRSQVKETFADLVANAKAKFIFLSYNNEGLLSLEDIKEIMGRRGEYGFFTKDYHRFKADAGRDYSANKTVEYLHYVICS